MNSLNNQSRKEYNISVSIEYFDEELKLNQIMNFTILQILAYNISKDSINYKYNIHMLTLIAVKEFELLHLKNKKNWIIIKLSDDDGIVYSEKRFKMMLVNMLEESQQLYNLQVVMLSEVPYEFLHSHRYSKISTLDSYEVFSGITSHQLLSTILQRIQTDSSDNKKIQANWNTFGKINQIYPSIRIPETFTDIEIFEYILKTFPPFLFEQYFIFDDFHIPKNKIMVPYNIIISNLFNIVSSYEQISINTLDSINIVSKQFLSSVPLIDHDNFYKLIGSTIILNNGINNQVSKIKPFYLSNNLDKIKTIDSNLDPSIYIKQLEAKKILVDKKSSIEAYRFVKIDITEISFLSVYNLTEKRIYNHLPLTIDYKFYKNSHNRFWADVDVQFAKVPNKIY